ncbi:hypothetical protein [Streptomyces sp. H39-C1]|uniref:hypothetical protein n=1 Tax=Streptomyces sp. H39-C1 TaxID=3004355 RepID=UPI0022B037A4|nr:hypothetical protein [Streptomyces sp. H39-C1]MCZ4098032.1 hypothetical protein [Streptomyces sp. H39-C1]
MYIAPCVWLRYRSEESKYSREHHGGVLEQLADRTGKGNFFRLADHGLNGAYALNQAWHEGWETIAALIATTKATAR